MDLIGRSKLRFTCRFFVARSPLALPLRTCPSLPVPSKQFLLPNNDFLPFFPFSIFPILRQHIFAGKISISFAMTEFGRIAHFENIVKLLEINWAARTRPRPLSSASRQSIAWNCFALAPAPPPHASTQHILPASPHTKPLDRTHYFPGHRGKGGSSEVKQLLDFYGKQHFVPIWQHM